MDGIVLASGIGPDVTNWAFAIDGIGTDAENVEHLDHIASFSREIDGRLYRIVCSGSDPDATAELITYDRRGVASYVRIDGMADPHGLDFDGTHLIVPCSALNEIWRLDLNGKVVSRWRAPGEGDAWHVNGVHVRDGRVYASAFGAFASNAEMVASRATDAGMIFDVDTRRAVVRGLHCPHDPQFVDGAWLVCDSFNHRLVHVDETTGEIRLAVDLGAWTRGVAVFDDAFVVGLSARRHDRSDTNTASLAIVDRATWRVRGRIALPCHEINGLSIISRDALQALRNGFRTNDYRVSVNDRREMFRLVGGIQPTSLITPMEPLDSDDRAVRVTGDLQHSTLRPKQTIDFILAIENRGSQTLFSNPPYPILIAIQWINAYTRETVASERRALPKPLAPNGRLDCSLPLVVPDAPGAYVLRATLIQEWIAWFDEDVAQRVDRSVTVTARTSRGDSGSRFAAVNARSAEGTDLD